MNYIKIENCNLLNGEGARVILWVAGCEHKCKNCHNQSTWDPSTGTLFNDSTLDDLMNLLSNDYISGLTISGGDPLHPNNFDEVLKIAKHVKNVMPNKTIWVWTGYLVSNLEKEPRKEIFKYIDTIIDGPYIESKPTTKKYRGSDNQKMYKIKDGICHLVD
ncbi:MAG: anaerobic ribonucleoside-triphosphate reductase activating protein [Mycoplasma sp.]